MHYVGVDGCGVGWIAVFGEGPHLAYALFGSIQDIAQAFPNAKMICVDIPIGLPWSEHPVRACDRLARVALGRNRQSSVFPVPCRRAVHAGTPLEAREANQAELNRSLSAQALGIRPKIAEVDAFLGGDLRARSVFLEVHPEICFWGLAGRSPMAQAKKSAGGAADRLKLLKSYAPDVHQLLDKVSGEHPRRDVCPDDVLVDCNV